MRENVNSASALPLDGAPQQEWPKAEVENFGPIAEGTVELRPLTVFAGPSNTGKSWLATLIYAMTRHINGGYGIFHNYDRPFELRTSDPSYGWENLPGHSAEWLQNLQEDKPLRLQKGEKKILASALESGQGALEEEILRCFGLAEASHLVRERGAGAARVTFVNAAAPISFETRQRLTVTRAGNFSLGVDVMTDECRPHHKDAFVNYLKYVLEAESDGRAEKGTSRYLIADMWRLLLLNPGFSSTYYLPADRGGVMHAHRAVVGALIQGASSAALRRHPSLPALSGVLGDFLQQLVDLTGRRPTSLALQQSMELPADSLEREILAGEIGIERSEVDYPHFTYRPDGWKRELSLMSVSSMVSELAPVALYLRHCVRPSDLLILEEPEAHLHPAMQVRLVREISGWVKYGIKVLITTHSEWVVEEIANLVAADAADKAGGLPQGVVGVWKFDTHGSRKSAGSRIREIDWDPDEGGFPVGFGAVASELMNSWASLLDDAE